MATLGGYNYTPEIVDTIQNEVKNYLDCDNILTEYISVMVRNNKTKEEMANDLSDFIGIDKAGEFAGWLWNFIPSYFESIKQKQINDAIMQQPPQTATKKPPTQRLILNAVKQAAEDTKNVRVPMTEESLDDSQNDSNNNNNNTYSNGKKDFIKKDKQNNRKNGNSNKQQPNFTITMNDINTVSNGSKKRKNLNRDDDDEIDRSNTMNDKTDDPVNIPLDSIVSPKKSKKERCSYWPLCRNAEACIYHHPTTQCLLFPNCTYGDKCLYIHPSIPCKFGINCTNVDCVYNHPQRPTASVAAPPAMNEIPCRNGFACPNKKGCGFYHPPPACKFGASCNMGKSCPFGHGKPCLYGLNCVTPNCTFAHHSTEQPIPDCKFGKDCTNPKCKFTHAEEREIDKANIDTDHLSSTLPSTPPKEEPIQTDEKIQEPIDV
ncbi:hypothetical protein RB653_009683 [Dictyostelium firmibasis]|uniref:Zinc finger CCCH domain-containing protein 14 n=1 Tax=Dictyostelium firmibasis TaxID=79012 RepID=A0AAN7TSK3_9MYCE